MKIQPRTFLVSGFLLLCLLLGGSAQNAWASTALQLLGVALIAGAAILPPAPDSTVPPAARYLILGFLLLVLAQLVPLPPAVWESLPGREKVVEGLAALNLRPPAFTWSEAPYRTVATLLAAIPSLAVFIACARLGGIGRLLPLTILAGTIVSIVFAAVQVSAGQDSWAYLYPIHSTGGVGLFANQNHMATLLLVAIPMTAALIVSASTQRRISTFGRYGLGAAFLLLLLAGIVLNRSLAAFGLAPAVILASAVIFPAARRWRKAMLAFTAAALLAAIAFVAVSPIATDALGKDAGAAVSSRQDIWATTASAIVESFPAGTGLGTFGDVYQLHEDPDRVGFEYVNHAHDDYLELVLELGLPGILLILGFLYWWLLSVFRIWRSPLSSPLARASTIVTATILAHSIVDFPLRTASISAIFAACLAVIALQARQTAARDSRQAGTARHVRLG